MDASTGFVPLATKPCAGHVDFAEIGAPDGESVEKGCTDVAHDVVAAVSKGSDPREVAGLVPRRDFAARDVHPLAEPYEPPALYAMAYLRRRRSGGQEFRTSDHHHQTM